MHSLHYKRKLDHEVNTLFLLFVIRSQSTEEHLFETPLAFTIIMDKFRQKPQQQHNKCSKKVHQSLHLCSVININFIELSPLIYRLHRRNCGKRIPIMDGPWW